ncbi:MAG: hypothetical protein KC492_01075, partial [Myxococcales bacterium]|nr:hypothetical protein [Myxococcales bacterium]
THKYARNLTVVDGQAYWATYGGSFEQRDGTLWTVPTHGRVETASEAASGEPRVVLEQVGWVEHLAVANGTLFYSTSRIPDVFSVERLAIPALED